MFNNKGANKFPRLMYVYYIWAISHVFLNAEAGMNNEDNVIFNGCSSVACSAQGHDMHDSRGRWTSTLPTGCMN